MKTRCHSLRQQRRAIKPHERESFAKNLALQAKRVIKIQYKYKVALYLENDGEINPKYIKKWLNLQKIELYLPVLVKKSLKFAKIGEKFKKNRFGINEPDTSVLLNANQMNIILMPLVGFDVNKNRIGMGGGFYDRTLAFKKRQGQYTNPKLCGLAFDCQKVDKIEPKAWDIPLDMVITPTTIYR
ncbi:MAG: 5-formyltetrahydrofolate cyclo-ligase [Catillopecten margaritatus gill symbiont]|uniref:5-formyltetrahydrofolate cyclo-ligase n=1 Tax=Catillopecten margaritatus gill symbiont TaxID=3083288 RepID=A0AAU6PH99_9GAMM